MAHRHMSELTDSSSSVAFFPQTTEFKDFHSQWKKRLSEQKWESQEIKKVMDSVNPLYIPRNHQIETAIEKANNGDFSHFFQMLEISKTPFEEQNVSVEFQNAPLQSQLIENP